MKLILLIGCMASGKDTILNRLLEETKAEGIVSFTSRPMRAKETNGVEYNFVTKEEMLLLEEQNKLLEFKEYKVANGDTWYYGLPNNWLNDENKDKTFITIVDIKGMLQIKKHLKSYKHANITTIFIDAEEETRKQRAFKRDNITDIKRQEIERRIEKDREEVDKYKRVCDYIMRNESKEDLEWNINKIKEII